MLLVALILNTSSLQTIIFDPQICEHDIDYLLGVGR